VCVCVCVRETEKERYRERLRDGERNRPSESWRERERRERDLLGTVNISPSPRNNSDINREMVIVAGWSLGLMSRAGCGTNANDF